MTHRPLLILLLASILTACGGPGFDRPALLQAAPGALQDDLRSADRHILVVRHARKVAEDCNALDCALSARGEAMVAELATLLGPNPVDLAMASAACRTVLTARAGGAEIIQHQPAPGIEQGCETSEPVSRSRAVAMLAAQESDARWTLVSEHSNTACLWVAALVDPAGTPCSEGGLPSEAYGDVFWLYQLQGTWHLVVLAGVFDVDAEPSG